MRMDWMPGRTPVAVVLVAVLSLAALRLVAQEATTRPAPGGSATPTTQPAGGTLRLTVRGAILMALENNRALAVERYNPAMDRESIEIQRAVFDPTLTASFSATRKRTDTGSSDTSATDVDASIGYSQDFPLGTELDATLTVDGTVQSGDDDFDTRLALTVTQPLLRGFGTDVNLVSVRQAQIDLLTSQYELRGFTETLVSDVEKAYWDYAVAQQRTEIVRQALKVAEDQLTDTQWRVRVGTLAGAQLAAAEAEVALRNQELINARSTEATARLTLLRLLSPEGESAFADKVLLLNAPAVTPVELGPVEQRVQSALRQRPDINQAKLLIRHRNLEIVETRNGLLPVLDLFITLGRTGYADSFGKSLEEFLGKGSSYDVQVGVDFEYPPLNRSARATHARAVLNRDQAETALTNLEQLAELDVRSAYIEVGRTAEQVTAAAATRKSRAEALRVETARYQNDKSTSLLVNIAQRDLLTSQLAEVQAVVDYLKALVDLYRQEGSLLIHRGIQAPGGAPARFTTPMFD